MIVPVTPDESLKRSAKGSTIQELRTQAQVQDVIKLARLNRDELASHLPFEESAVLATCELCLKDVKRELFNIWIAYKEGEPIGYAVGGCATYYFNWEKMARLEILFVKKENRSGWTAVKLVKAFHAWTALAGAREAFVGVVSTDKDRAKHIRRLFPNLGFHWAGSYYVKENKR